MTEKDRVKCAMGIHDYKYHGYTIDEDRRKHKWYVCKKCAKIIDANSPFDCQIAYKNKRRNPLHRIDLATV